MNNNRYNRLILLAVVSFLLAACSSQPKTPASIVDSSRGSSAPTYTPPVTPVTAGSAPAEAGVGTYVVKGGDTLYRIALQFGRSYREIVEWNNLPSANEIKVGQVLRVVPPGSGTGSVGAAGTVASPIDSANKVDVRPLSATPLPAAAGTGTPGGIKNTPSGDKRPYSDANLADLQKQAGARQATPPPGAVVPATGEGVSTSAPASAAGWIWPTNGKIQSAFAQNKKGIDIVGDNGQAVNAAAPGKVVYAGTGIRGFGNLVIIKHSNDMLSAYAHNRSILVKEGQSVTRGQKIAEMGNTDSDSVKLHFEIRQAGKPVDPAKFLPAR